MQTGDVFDPCEHSFIGSFLEEELKTNRRGECMRRQQLKSLTLVVWFLDL